MTTASIHQQPDDCDMPEPTLEEVDTGIYAYIQLDGSWGLNNPGVLVGDSGVTLIDTCFTEHRARAFAEAVRSVSKESVQTLVNTHHHGDHTWGNFVFPGATVVGHELCRQAVIDTGFAIKPFFPTVDWGDLELVPPFVTFEDHLRIWVNDLEVDLIYVGPAHTTNDVVAWIPKRKVLFAGDIVFNHCTPFVLQGSLTGLKEAVQRLVQLDPERLVPGHGALCGPEALVDTLEYIDFVEHVAKASFEAGVPPLEAARSSDLGRFEEWHERERLVANLHRAHSELRGEPRCAPLDLATIFQEMVAFNGGPIRCCA